ncbi:LA_3751/LA_3752 family putative glycosyltransferase [Leptospira levettii]|uniref:LA_3751/LA_3752 family putative glycosyltransferase n=1 Tax=Leptospira levettii TaxID=2023178 RepID=UPI00223E6119|nr:dolichyl-phosphate-mannose-protein mannosyltransferase [Leptospira levettii]MCW7475022.1 dolichyl-phosphate-mannose-protein mannosyltransferase [Leptospira levettii]
MKTINELSIFGTITNWAYGYFSLLHFFLLTFTFVLMKSILRSNFVLLFLLLFLVFFQYIINIRTFFVSDPLIKMIQVMSLWENKWSTEGIIYPAISIDPDFLLSPFNDGFIFKNNDRLIGNYPIAFTFLYSLIGFIPFTFLPYFNVLFLFLFILLLYKNNIQVKSIVIIVLGSVIFPLLLDFSENGFFLVLGSYGYVFLWKAFQKEKTSDWILGNLLLGLSLWFRLEGILFFASIHITILFLELKNKSFQIKNLFRIERYIVFTLLLILFLSWNQYSYSHPLGPRYLATYSNTGKSIFTQLPIFLSMIFTYPRENGFSVGFFLISPILLFSLLYSFKNKFKELNISFHSMVTCIFFFIVGMTSPNDGITLTGRYFLLSLTPLAFILNEKLIELEQKKITYYILLFWNVLATIIVLAIFYFTSKELRKVQADVKKIESPLVVTTNEFISGAFGLKLIESKVVCIRNQNLVNYFFENSKTNSVREFSVLTVAKSTKYIENEHDIYQEILKVANQFDFQCENAEIIGKIMSNRCKLK